MTILRGATTSGVFCWVILRYANYIRSIFQCYILLHFFTCFEFNSPMSGSEECVCRYDTSIACRLVYIFRFQILRTTWKFAWVLNTLILQNVIIIWINIEKIFESVWVSENHQLDIPDPTNTKKCSYFYISANVEIIIPGMIVLFKLITNI